MIKMSDNVCDTLLETAFKVGHTICPTVSTP